MLSSKECFKGGRVDRDALKLFIKDIKKNTKLSDEDAAVIAASKVNHINSANILYPGNIDIILLLYSQDSSNIPYIESLMYFCRLLTRNPSLGCGTGSEQRET